MDVYPVLYRTRRAFCGEVHSPGEARVIEGNFEIKIENEKRWISRYIGVRERVIDVI